MLEYVSDGNDNYSMQMQEQEQYHHHMQPMKQSPPPPYMMYQKKYPNQGYYATGGGYYVSHGGPAVPYRPVATQYGGGIGYNHDDNHYQYDYYNNYNYRMRRPNDRVMYNAVMEYDDGGHYGSGYNNHHSNQMVVDSVPYAAWDTLQTSLLL